MKLEDKKVVVTGGAGFIGSRLVERLVGGNEVCVIDDLSAGNREYVPDGASLRVADVLDYDAVRDAFEGADAVFHLAANPDVRSGAEDTRVHMEQNAEATNVVLDAVRDAEVETFAFASSSTVYGEAPTPTPETYGPLAPISLYGASKLACEGLCTAYEGTFGVETYVYRFANVVGGRGHGVIPDFVEKLRDDPTTLEILGDGRQRKSYTHVSDCVDAMLHVVESDACDDTFYNIGTRDTVSVTRIAEVVSDVMGIDPTFEYTGGERGWKGDVPRMRLDVEKLVSTGWEPKTDSEESVRRTAEELVEKR
ncbi:MAG: NAD-dependent epimerase/dehydratase family protein [Halobacteriales archaeon]|nr:NAD-dependent epimerase/dehydratase family protein [Halobacteriales archaeon]